MSLHFKVLRKTQSVDIVNYFDSFFCHFLVTSRGVADKLWLKNKASFTITIPTRPSMSFFLAAFRALTVFDKADIRELIEVYRETRKIRPQTHCQT